MATTTNEEESGIIAKTNEKYYEKLDKDWGE